MLEQIISLSPIYPQESHFSSSLLDKDLFSVIELYKGVIEHIGDDKAVVCLYDSFCQPKLTIDIPRKDLEESEVVLERGSVFELYVLDAGGEEYFYFNYVPPGTLTKEEIEQEEKKFDEVFS